MCLMCLPPKNSCFTEWEKNAPTCVCFHAWDSPDPCDNAWDEWANSPYCWGFTSLRSQWMLLSLHVYCDRTAQVNERIFCLTNLHPVLADGSNCTQCHRNQCSGEMPGKKKITMASRFCQHNQLNDAVTCIIIHPCILYNVVIVTLDLVSQWVRDKPEQVEDWEKPALPPQLHNMFAFLRLDFLLRGVVQ